MNEETERHEQELGERARRLFAESVDALDGQTRSRLRQARARAVEAAGRKRGIWSDPRLIAPIGAAAAAVLAIVLFWPGPGTQVQPVESSVLSDLDILLDGDELELFEDLEFYAWLLEQPQMLAADADEDGSG